VAVVLWIVLGNDQMTILTFIFALPLLAALVLAAAA